MRWLIFLHIPRTAGTTFLRILRREYGPDAVLDLYDSTFGEEAAGLVQAGRRIRVVAGHFSFGAHEQLSGPCRYVTFLRDPVERVISHYHFVRSRPDHYLHPAASRMSLAQYVESCGRAEPNNDQTRLLAGTGFASSDGTWSPDMLAAAIRNLDDHVSVGLTEAFDLSIVSMRRLFGWRLPLYVPSNVGMRPPDERVSKGVREQITSFNALDVELYRHARERFEREVAAQGDRCTRELRRFRALNALYALSRRVSRPARGSTRVA